MSRVPLKTLSGPFGTLAYSDEGEGPVLLAIHGVPGSHRDFNPLARALAGRLRLIRVDLPGFGDSPRGAAESLPSRAELVLDIVRALDLPQVTLIGHSMGGAVVLRAASLAPDRVKGVALLASVGVRPHQFYRKAPVNLMVRLSRSPLALRILHPLLVWTLTRSGFPFARSPDAVRLTMAALGDLHFPTLRETVAALRVPSFQVWCDDDPLIEPSVQEELAQALPPGPRLSFRDGGHVPQKSHGPEITEALVSWMRA